MRVLLLLLRKDLLRRRRDPLSVLVMLAFPLVFAGILALALGGGSSSPRALILVHSEDALLGKLVLGALTSEELADLVEVKEVGPEGRERIGDGEGSALLHIPAGSTRGLFEGEVVTFELIRNPAQEILPEIAEKVSATLVDVLALLGRFLQERKGDLGVASWENFDEISDADWGPLMLSMRRTFKAGDRYFKTPPLKLEIFDIDAEGVRTAREEDDGDEGDEGDEGARSLEVFAFVLPGLAVYALFLIGDQMMRDILTENQEGTLRRQLTAPITAGQVVIAKVMSAAVVGTLALLILMGILLGLTRLRVDPLAFAALGAGIVLASTGFATLIYGVVTNDRQGSAVSSLTTLMMAFSGGAFIPLKQLPAALRGVSPVSPFYWGTTGFQALLDDASLAEILPSIGVLCAMGAVLLAVGSALIHRRMMRGGA